ncbi:short chain enoyl-CoA hydratase [Thalassovita litoralis]|uniref:Short chain enoyl-CoA hydratase n=1 Tax=Thalassovita litoralis TaxID=1010611 RepID=A0A521AGP8_9RHOB|nr:enoyl-CoA hydratase [Thalassovita litoralis]SMO33880.1 short chain enoyl-CoA hydratase [Thalassovita litoralis]
MSNSEEATVLCEQTGGVMVITLNRPQAMNALSVQLRAELAAALRTAEADDSVRVIVLTGAGDRAFSAGLDLKEISSDPSKLRGASTAEVADNPANALMDCRCPIIAAVNGFAITGGLELAMACDVLIASENASFGDTHAAVGVMPGWGLSQRLSRIVGPSRAKEMHFGCKRIDAQTALDWGLVNRVVPQADLMPLAMELAESFAAHDPVIMREMKRVVDRGYDMPMGEAMVMEGEVSRTWNSRAQPVNVAQKG